MEAIFGAISIVIKIQNIKYNHNSALATRKSGEWKTLLCCRVHATNKYSPAGQRWQPENDVIPQSESTWRAQVLTIVESGNIKHGALLMMLSSFV
ncbi:hypothetical protein AHAS_Ahas13G0393800 [Arachis hypogaea]